MTTIDGNNLSHLFKEIFLKQRKPGQRIEAVILPLFLLQR
jgi:hypothetical protein